MDRDNPNIILWKTGEDGELLYLLVVVRPCDNQFIMRSFAFIRDSTGERRVQPLSGEVVPTWDYARKRAKKYTVRKSKSGWTEVAEGAQVPVYVRRCMAVAVDRVVSPEELLQLIRQAEIERYVVFRDNTGLEDFFDVGVEYLAEEDNDPHCIKVYAKDGSLREVLRDRLDSVEETENVQEIQKAIASKDCNERCGSCSKRIVLKHDLSSGNYCGEAKFKTCSENLCPIEKFREMNWDKFFKPKFDTKIRILKGLQGDGWKKYYLSPSGFPSESLQIPKWIDDGV